MRKLKHIAIKFNQNLSRVQSGGVKDYKCKRNRVSETSGIILSSLTLLAVNCTPSRSQKGEDTLYT